MEALIQFVTDVLRSVSFWVVIGPWEHGLRVRRGKYVKLLMPGIRPKIPILDKIFVQSMRLRVEDLPRQDIMMGTETWNLSGAVFYRIIDIQKLYFTAEHPEEIIKVNAMSLLLTMKLHNLEEVRDALRLELKSYGIWVERVEYTDFVKARTYRLISQDERSSSGTYLESSAVVA